MKEEKLTKKSKKSIPRSVLLSSTFKPPKSDLLGRVADFLPKLKEANFELEQQIKNGQNLDIEIFDEGEDKEHIEMNLDLGVFDVATKSPEIEVTGNSDKTLIHDLSEVKETGASPKNHCHAQILEITSNSQIPVVYSKPSKHHKKVETTNVSAMGRPEIHITGSSKDEEKQANSTLPLIEEL